MRVKVRARDRILVALGTFFVAAGFLQLVLATRSAKDFDLRVVVSVLGVTGLGLGLVRKGARSGWTILASVVVAAVACALLVALGPQTSPKG